MIKDEKLTMEYMKKQVSQEKDQKSKRVKAKKRSKKFFKAANFFILIIKNIKYG
jgi:hypothetical protein